MIIGNFLLQGEIAESYVFGEPELDDFHRETRLKFEAEMALTEKRISIPTRAEWIGINLLERDDEL